MMDVEQARTIGARLRRIRRARGKPQEVIAGLAGITKGYLSMLENGQRSIDRLSLIVALADALQVAPSELIQLPVPAPANGGTDSAVEAVRVALNAVSHDLPDGQVLPVDLLRARVTAMIDALCRCERERDVGAALPALIRDVHTTLAAGRDVGELLWLAAWLHTQATVPWLSLSGAPVDLRSQAVMVARHAAREHEGAVPMGLVAAAGARVALAEGAVPLAAAVLDATTIPMTTSETMQLAGFLALRSSVVAAADRSTGDVDTALEHAAELAARTGEGNAFGLGFGPVNVDLYRMSGLLEVGDYERAVSIAEGMDPEAHVNRSRHAAYWADYGQALARIRGRHEDAVLALRRVEQMSAHRVQRNPMVRELLGELLTRPYSAGVGRELRGMAYRAGLDV